MARPVIPIWIDGVEIPCLEYQMQMRDVDETREVVLGVYRCVDAEVTTTGEIRKAFNGWSPSRYRALQHLRKTGQFVSIDRQVIWRRWLSPDPLLLPSRSRVCRIVAEKAQKEETDDILTLIEVMHNPRIIHDSFRENER